MNRGAVGALLLALGGCEREVALDADPAARQAEVAAAEQHYAANPADPIARYNLGTTLLRAARYAHARAPLELAATATDTLVAQHASYNLGNTDLQPAFDSTAMPGRQEALRRAVDAYKRALLLRPADQDAKWNLELARRLLDQPPEQKSPEGGGGGGGGGGEGGGGGSDPQSGRQDPQPQAGAAGGSRPQASPQAAERLLSNAEQRERGVQQDRLRKPQPPTPTAH